MSLYGWQGFWLSTSNGRLNSNFTRLPSELVQYLTIDGNHLIELDCTNSQPLIAASLFDPTPDVEYIMEEFLDKQKTSYIIRLGIADMPDFKYYLSLVSDANFYNFMMDEFKKNNIKFNDREDFKNQIFTVFFGKNNSIHYSPAVRLFGSIFPSMLNGFELIKEVKHNKLSILLQKIESHTFLDCVTPKVILKYPELPFITKHDSLLPVEIKLNGQKDEFQKLVSETIENVIGIRPTLRWKSSCSTTKRTHSSENGMDFLSTFKQSVFLSQNITTYTHP